VTDGLRHWNKTLGLTARLVAGYMLVAAFTFSAAAVFLHQQLHHGFEVEDAELLSDHVATLRHEVDQHPTNLEEAAETIRSTAANRNLEKYYGRLVDAEGRTLVETPGFASLGLDLDLFPPPVGADQKIHRVVRSTSASGVPLFFASAAVSRGTNDAPLLYYVALDITHVDLWIAQFRLQLVIVVIGGSIFSGILAWLMTRRGLEPLRNITQVMQRVGAGELGERVGKNPWPRELADIAGAFDIMLGRLSEAFQRLSQFSADAAHEFRTPLNNLMISTSILLTQNREGEEYRQAMVANLSEFERLKGMVDSLLFIARADNAETELHRTDVDIRAMAEDVADCPIGIH
jgi:two-component system heavy metal sensor histidine kinase CusS